MGDELTTGDRVATAPRSDRYRTLSTSVAIPPLLVTLFISQGVVD
jgi:hypothetical protein